MTKQEAIELVESGPSSILTREDVVNLLNGIEAGDTRPEEDETEIDDDTLIQIKCGKLLDKIDECLSDELSAIELAQEAHVSLSMDYDNHVVVDSIEWDASDAVSNVVSKVEDWLNAFVKDKTK